MGRLDWNRASLYEVIISGVFSPHSFCLLQIMMNPSCLGRALSHTKRCFTPSFLLCTSIRRHSSGMKKHRAKDFQGALLPCLQWAPRIQSWPSKKILKINIYMYYLYISQVGNYLPSASHIFQTFHLKSTGLESCLWFNEGWASCGLTRQQEVLLTEKPRMVGDFDNITRVGNTGRGLWIKLSDLLGPSAFTAKQNNFSGL